MNLNSIISSFNLINNQKKLLAIVFTFLIMSCANQKSNNPETTTEESVTTEISYLALGDSYTIGQGVAEDLRWPNQLSAALENNDVKVTQTDIIAKTGWTTTNLKNAIDTATLSEYNLVSLLIGVNNQYQQKPFSLYETEFIELLNTSITLAGNINRVFVVSIPDYGVTPFGSSSAEKIGKELDMYNAYAKAQCESRNIPFVDITEISRTLGSSEGALAPDQLHPSGSQYLEWSNAILPTVMELVKN